MLQEELNEIKFQLLVGMTMRMDKTTGSISINPFYKADKTEVQSNFLQAKTIYEEEVFPLYTTTYCRMKALDLGIAEDDIVNAVYDGRIPKMVYYNELREFTL